MDMHGGASLQSLSVAEAGIGFRGESHPGPEVNELVINGWVINGWLKSSLSWPSFFPFITPYL